MHKLINQLPSGWWEDKRGIRRRSPGKAGDLAPLIRKAPYTLRWNDLSKEVQLDGEHITADYLETAYVDFQEHGWNAQKTEVQDAVVGIAKQRSFHPIQRYFQKIQQDKSIQPVDLSTFAQD